MKAPKAEREACLERLYKALLAAEQPKPGKRQPVLLELIEPLWLEHSFSSQQPTIWSHSAGRCDLGIDTTKFMDEFGSDAKESYC